jgi:hypothetical protein
MTIICFSSLLKQGKNVGANVCLMIHMLGWGHHGCHVPLGISNLMLKGLILYCVENVFKALICEVQVKNLTPIFYNFIKFIRPNYSKNMICTFFSPIPILNI